MRTLITGGAASGKSAFAEELLLSAPGPRVYIATLRVYSDEERQRVARHEQLRAGKGFQVVERSENLAALELPQELQGGAILLECLGDLVANEMYEPETWERINSQKVCDSVLNGLAMLESCCENLIVVTNEVGADGVSCSQETQAYIRLLGKLNCSLASQWDNVIECVSQVPCVLKGELSAWTSCVR